MLYKKLADGLINVPHHENFPIRYDASSSLDDDRCNLMAAPVSGMCRDHVRCCGWKITPIQELYPCDPGPIYFINCNCLWFDVNPRVTGWGWSKLHPSLSPLGPHTSAPMAARWTEWFQCISSHKEVELLWVSGVCRCCCGWLDKKPCFSWICSSILVLLSNTIWIANYYL